MKEHPKREELIELLWTFSCDGTSNPENVVDDIIIMFEKKIKYEKRYFLL